MVDDHQAACENSGMAEIEMTEFPFVASLKKGEKSKLREAMDIWQEVRALTREKGPLLPQTFCARLGGVTPQRIDQLVAKGTLEKFKIGDAAMITEASFDAWMHSERKPGQPKKEEKPKGWARKRWDKCSQEARDICFPGLKKKA